MSSNKLTLDQEIIARMKAGDKEAIFDFYDKSFKPIKKMVLENSGNVEDAKDVFHLGWEAIISKINKDQLNYDNLNFSGLLYSICRNKWRDELRRRKKLPQTDIEAASLSPVEEKIVKDADRFLIAKDAMNELREKCQKIIEYFYLQKMRMTQIAEKIGLNSPESAKVTKNRCMNKLREIVKRKMDEADE